jgi:hypothetical protein
VADPLLVLGEPIGANDSDRCTGTTPAAERGILSEADARGLHEGWSMARSSTPSWDQHHWTVPHLLRRYVIHCDLGRAVKPLTNRVV